MTHNRRRSFAARATASARARERRSRERTASSGVILWVLLGAGVILLVVFWSTRRGSSTAEDTARRARAASVPSESSEGDFLSRLGASAAEVELPKVKPRKKKRTVAKVDPTEAKDSTRPRADEARPDIDLLASARALAARTTDQSNARVDAEPSGDDRESSAPVTQAPQRVETRVVTLRLSGNVGPARLDPNDPFTWGRLGYFFQQEMSPRYFLVFPGGGVPTIVKGPTMFKGRVVDKGEDLRALRPPPGPRGIFGSPKYRIDLLAVAGSAGTMTFYGRKIGTNNQCQLSAQIYDLQGEKPRLVDSFTVTEKVTRLAEGPPGPQDRQAYQMAIEKLVKRLRSTSCFKG